MVDASQKFMFPTGCCQHARATAFLEIAYMGSNAEHIHLCYFSKYTLTSFTPLPLASLQSPDLQALLRTKSSQRCNMVSAGYFIIWFSHFIHRQTSASSSKQPSPSPLDTRAFSFHMTYCVVQCDVSSVSCSLKETSFHLALEYLRIQRNA